MLITVHAHAPAKPRVGAPCNGCGACCISEPCPVSRVWLGHREGACPALKWDDAALRYQCGMATRPGDSLAWLPAVANPVAARLFRRWIAAGIGCDFDAEEISEQG